MMESAITSVTGSILKFDATFQVKNEICVFVVINVKVLLYVIKIKKSNVIFCAQH